MLMVQRYKAYLSELGFYQAKNRTSENDLGSSYKMDPDLGNGDYWLYSVDDRYCIAAYDLYFKCSVGIRFIHPAFFMVGLEKIASNEQQCTKNNSSSVNIYIGGEGECRQHVERGTVMKNISVCATPEFYEQTIAATCTGINRFHWGADSLLNMTECIPEIAEILTRLKTFRPFGSIASLYYNSKVTELLCLLVQWKMQRQVFSLQKRIPDSDKVHLEEVINFLNQNYHTPVHIDALAAKSCMSRSKLTNLFKHVCGTSILDYVKSLRMKHAKEMLATTNLKIETIGNDVGYKLHRSFSQAFKQATGTTPKQYRDNVLSGRIRY